jgi:hypothetical protein
MTYETYTAICLDVQARADRVRAMMMARADKEERDARSARDAWRLGAVDRLRSRARIEPWYLARRIMDRAWIRYAAANASDWYRARLASGGV